MTAVIQGVDCETGLVMYIYRWFGAGVGSWHLSYYYPIITISIFVRYKSQISQTDYVISSSRQRQRFISMSVNSVQERHNLICGVILKVCGNNGSMVNVLWPPDFKSKYVFWEKKRTV